MGPDGMHPQVLRELGDFIARALLIILERSWQSGEVLENWEKAEVFPVTKKGRKGDAGTYRPVSLSSILGVVMEWLILGAISKHVEDKKVIVSSQHGFTRGKSCLKQSDYLLGWDNWLTILGESHRYGPPGIQRGCWHCLP